MSNFTGSPALVSVVQTTEILMSLILESIFVNTSWAYGIKVFGSCIVASQIICLAFLNDIQGKVDTLYSSEEKNSNTLTNNNIEKDIARRISDGYFSISSDCSELSDFTNQ